MQEGQKGVLRRAGHPWLGNQGGFLGSGSLKWALKDRPDMGTQMFKERCSAQRCGAGKGGCCVEHMKVEARAPAPGGPSVAPGVLSEMKTSQRALD